MMVSLVKLEELSYLEKYIVVKVEEEANLEYAINSSEIQERNIFIWIGTRSQIQVHKYNKKRKKNDNLYEYKMIYL
jgi:hypothetical protein